MHTKQNHLHTGKCAGNEDVSSSCGIESVQRWVSKSSIDIFTSSSHRFSSCDLLLRTTYIQQRVSEQHVRASQPVVHYPRHHIGGETCVPKLILQTSQVCAATTYANGMLQTRQGFTWLPFRWSIFTHTPWLLPYQLERAAKKQTQSRLCFCDI